jgi:hypothetical protein
MKHRVSLGSDRGAHEQRAIEQARRAGKMIREARQLIACQASVAHLVEAAKSNAQARTHLTSIGPHDGRRTRKLWGMVGRQGKEIDSSFRGLEKSGCIRRGPP